MKKLVMLVFVLVMTASVSFASIGALLDVYSIEDGVIDLKLEWNQGDKGTTGIELEKNSLNILIGQYDFSFGFYIANISAGIGHIFGMVDLVFELTSRNR